MFRAINMLFSMFYSLFSAGNKAAESLDEIAGIGLDRAKFYSAQQRLELESQINATQKKLAALEAA